MTAEDLENIRLRHAEVKRVLRISEVMPPGLDPHRLLDEAHADRAALIEEVDRLARMIEELRERQS